MRLLNVNTLELVEFTGQQVPQYTIISHRWEGDEITYKDFQKGRRKDSLGYQKVIRCCEVVRSHGFEWTWIDTACIDKRSSAELSEAINSMYAWYERAERCYAYLSDLAPPTNRNDEAEITAAFSRSAWFRRGWTLQELLAPRVVIFLDERYGVIGHKKVHTEDVKGELREYKGPGPKLNSAISSASGVPFFYLTTGRIHDATIAQRMSWASQRTTTRPEDEAYCLLGILEVNMPLLYGEGHGAFRRLQEELIRRSNDQSIFAWWRERQFRPTRQNFLTGVLARSPRDFKDSGKVHTLPRSVPSPRHYTLTNNGLLMEALVDQTTAASAVLMLDCICACETCGMDGKLIHIDLLQGGADHQGRYLRANFFKPWKRSTSDMLGCPSQTANVDTDTSDSPLEMIPSVDRVVYIETRDRHWASD
jgi:hypothetical protein